LRVRNIKEEGGEKREDFIAKVIRRISDGSLRARNPEEEGGEIRDDFVAQSNKGLRGILKKSYEM